MIINGGSRSAGSYFATHLMRTDHNQRVELVEIRGLGAENIRDAFLEMKAVASGTRCTNYFYHANINTRENEVLTPEQWQLAADRLERELGLVDQPRFVVEHEKEGRIHRHVVWSRIDVDSMTAISDSLTYRKHERAARALEEEFGHAPVPSVLISDRDTARPERNPEDWESLRAQDSKLDPKAIKAEVTALYQASDNGTAFAAALSENGYILVRGDRRDFCIIDRHGDEHSLARRISGVKAAELRERMADVDREALPTVAEGRILARAGEGEAGDDKPASPQGEGADRGAVDEPAAEDAELVKLHEQLVASLQASEPAAIAPAAAPTTGEPTETEAVHKATIAQAISDQTAMQREEIAQPGGRFERLKLWWSSVREYASDWRGQLVDRYERFRGRETEIYQPEAMPTPPSSSTPPTPPQQGIEPSL